MLNKKDQRTRRSRQTRVRIARQRVARLTVFRTNLHIYANVISDDGTSVLASASTVEAEVRKELGAPGKGANVGAAALIGKRIAEKAKALVSKRSPSTAQASPITDASRPWPKPPAKPASVLSKEFDNGKVSTPRADRR
jgi:large subunit ribosomal protein L18